MKIALYCEIMIQSRIRRGNLVVVLRRNATHLRRMRFLQ
jgi:hypothetical protein